jgi:hypothetical protein
MRLRSMTRRTAPQVVLSRWCWLQRRTETESQDLRLDGDSYSLGGLSELSSQASVMGDFSGSSASQVGQRYCSHAASSESGRSVIALPHDGQSNRLRNRDIMKCGAGQRCFSESKCSQLLWQHRSFGEHLNIFLLLTRRQRSPSYSRRNESPS